MAENVNFASVVLYLRSTRCCVLFVGTLAERQRKTRSNGFDAKSGRRKEGGCLDALAIRVVMDHVTTTRADLVLNLHSIYYTYIEYILLSAPKVLEQHKYHFTSLICFQTNTLSAADLWRRRLSSHMCIHKCMSMAKRERLYSPSVCHNL